MNIDNMHGYREFSQLQFELVSCIDDQPDCSCQPPTKEVMKGEIFHQSLVAVDHVNHTLCDIPIHSFLKFEESGLGEGQLSQKTKNNCTNLSFSVLSPHSSEGPCKDATLSLGIINIHF